jgi:hypothetical protein
MHFYFLLPKLFIHAFIYGSTMALISLINLKTAKTLFVQFACFVRKKG